MFSIDPKKVGSINDGGRRLKIGAHPYTITGAAMSIVKSNPTGKEQQVVIDLLNGEDYSCKVYLSVMSPNDVQREIAAKTLVGFADAAGIGGILKPERLKSFIGKTVVITTRETAGKGEKKGETYVNISTIEPYDADAEEEEEEEETEEEEEEASEETEEEEEEETEEEEEEEEEETPPPAPKKKVKPAASKPAASKPAATKPKSGRPW